MKRPWLALVLVMTLGLSLARAAEEPPSSHESAGAKEHEEMGNPWPMFIIQVVGFGLLLWVILKFAGPGIKKTLDERRDKFAAAYDKIKKDTEEAERLVREFNDKLAGIQREAKERLDKALAEAQKMRTDMAAEGAAQMEELSAKAKREIALETAIALAEVKLEVVERSIAATREALARGVPQELQRKLVAAAIDELSTLQEVRLS